MSDIKSNVQAGGKGIDFGKLKELLEKEQYPHKYTYKFIGKNSHLFTVGLHKLEGEFKKLTPQGSRESGGAKHLAVTYVLEADDAQEIVSVLEAVTKVEDLLVIL